MRVKLLLFFVGVRVLLGSDFALFSNIFAERSGNFTWFRAEIKRIELNKFKTYNSAIKYSDLIVGN